MFTKILIGNRGEIACRIIKTARRMGIATVAVYSDADRGASHVALADESVAIGPAPAAQSYLSIEAIVVACQASGAQAVHPGYGFLSERAAFAAALADHGIGFIGPNVAAIAAMGDKIESKKLAQKAGVSVVPGWPEALRDADEAFRVAEFVGYPVLLKAAAGGGGKGMRIARSGAEVAEAFARGQSEARSSFGDDRLFIERFIVDPRHIEIQVLGDRHGNVIHLGERECSIQRRHQKVIEESPSPFVDDDLRARMGAQAVALAQAVNYDSAGTVEFVVGPDRSMYFLEMNTRLQVEHPVTELVTGIDLVEQMIRVAAGEVLTLQQDAVTLRGWAVESRVYAEDPARSFLPSSGRVSVYRPPSESHADGVTVRLDTALFEGDAVSIHYDAMIAKLITHADDRDAAIAAHAEALDGFAIEGIRHNLSFLSNVMDHPVWRSGVLSTEFIAAQYSNGFAPAIPDGANALVLVAVAAHIDHVLSARRCAISGQASVPNSAAVDWQRVVMLGDARYDIALEETGSVLAVRFQDAGDTRRVTSAWVPGQVVWRGLLDGAPLACQVRPILNGVLLQRRGAAAPARVYTRREAELAARMPARVPGGSAKVLRCPMPGIVRALYVEVGTVVVAGEPLCVVEAMKMENVLRAEHDGTVARIHVVPGQSLGVDAEVLDFA